MQSRRYFTGDESSPRSRATARTLVDLSLARLYDNFDYHAPALPRGHDAPVTTRTTAPTRRRSSQISRSTPPLLSLIDMYDPFTGHSRAARRAWGPCRERAHEARRVAVGGIAEKLEVRHAMMPSSRTSLKSDDATKAFVEARGSRCVNLIAWMDIVSRGRRTWISWMPTSTSSLRRASSRSCYGVVDAKGKIDSLYDKGKDAEPCRS